MSVKRNFSLFLYFLVAPICSIAMAEQISFEVKGVVQIFDDSSSPVLPGVEDGDSCAAIFTYELDTPQADDSFTCCSYPHFPPTGTNKLVVSTGDYKFMTSSDSQYNVNVENDRDAGGGNYYDQFGVNGLSGESPDLSDDYEVSVHLNMQSEPNSLNALINGDLPLSFNIDEFDLPSTFADVSVEGDDYDSFASLRCSIQSIMKVEEGNTSSGSAVVVAPPATDETGSLTGTSPVSFAFNEVTTPGITTVEVSSSGPAIPDGFQLGEPPVFLNLDTSAVFNSPVEICVDYEALEFSSADDMSLLHYGGASWVDITSTVDIAGGQVCGETVSFSPFTLVKKDPVVLLPALSLNISVEKSNRNVTIAKLGDKLDYRIVAKNIGELPLINIRVKSELSRGSSKRCRSLALSRSCVLSVRYQVTRTDVERGFIDHVFSAESATLETMEKDHRIRVDRNPRLSLTHTIASADTPLYPGDSVEYSLVAENTGDVALSRVTVIDKNLSPSRKVCSRLDVDEQCVLSGVYHVTALDGDRGRFNNFGSVSSSDTERLTERLIVPISPHPVPVPVQSVPVIAISAMCIDTDGDGYGWDGADTCTVLATAPPAEPAPSDESPADCVDTDGDGWGWDGHQSCQIPAFTEYSQIGICVDSDGDGWGWNGQASCQP